MACTLEQKQTNLCSSGIGKVTDPIKLLQIAAQMACAAAVDPYDGLLVYTREGLGETTIVNPTGDIDLTFVSNQVTEVHCHNCPLITGFYLDDSAVLTTVDFINCPALTTWSMSGCDILTSLDLGFIQNADQISISNCAALTDMGFAGLQTASFFTITGCAAVTLSFPALTASSNEFFVYGNADLTSISLPLLATAGGASFHTNPLVTSYSFPSLQSCAAGLDVSTCDALLSVSCPVLVSVPSLIMNSNPVLTGMSVPSLQSVGGVNSLSCPSLQGIEFPAYGAVFVSADFSFCTALEDISFNGAVLPDGVVFGAIDCALNQATVDRILLAGVSGAITSNTIDLSGGTNSTPSAAGLLSKATLIGNGVTVATN